MKKLYLLTYALTLAQVNVSICTNTDSYSPEQKLLESAQKNDLVTTSLLLQAGTSIDCTDKIFFYYNTPLAIAADKGHIELVDYLLKHGALVNVTNKHKNTPLHRAAAKDHTKVVELLLQHGADPNIKGSDGYTPLYMATDNGYIETMRVLLEHGADPNIPTTASNQIPLHIATYKNNYLGIKLLLAWGTTLDHLNGTQKTPLTIALEKNNAEILETLTIYKIMLEQYMQPTQQLFRRALTHGYYKIALRLIKHDNNHDIVITAHELKLVYEQYLKADETTKSIYRALGRLLISYLRLTDNLQDLSQLYEPDKTSLILEFLRDIMPTPRKKQNNTTDYSYPIAKQGLIGVQELTKDLAEYIAHCTLE